MFQFQFSYRPKYIQWCAISFSRELSSIPPLSHNTMATMYQCEASCGRYFLNLRAMNSHLSSAKSCSWYMKGKFRQLDIDNTLPEPLDQNVTTVDNEDDWETYNPMDDNDLDFDIEDLYDPFDDLHFLPNVPIPLPEQQGGPGPQTASNRIQRAASQTPNRHRVLDDDDDTRVIDEHPTAGAKLRGSEPLHRQQSSPDKDGDISMEAPENPFFPFTSELDWKIGRWAVKDGPGHKAFDRLLQIPGVSHFYNLDCSLADAHIGR